MSVASQPVPFHWQQVDQRLSSILQSKVSEEIRKLINDDVAHIRFQNMHNGNSMTIPSQRLQMHRLRSEEWAARLYEGYCEIWQTQRMPVSPEFLREIAKNAISVLCSARVGAVTDEFVREQHRTRSNADLLKPALDAFKRDMQMLSHKWDQAAEVDAQTVRHMLASFPESAGLRIEAREVIAARARTRTLEAMITSIEARIIMAEHSLNGMLMAETPAYRKSSVEQSLSRLKEEKKELRSNLEQWHVRLKDALRHAEETEATITASLKTAAGNLPDSAKVGSAETIPGQKSKHLEQSGSILNSKTPAESLTRPKNEFRLPYRSALKRAIMALLIRKPNTSDLEICRDLDVDGAPLPEKWKMGDNRFFEAAYMDPRLRPRIQTAISKVRADLYRNRVIG